MFSAIEIRTSSALFVSPHFEASTKGSSSRSVINPQYAVDNDSGSREFAQKSRALDWMIIVSGKRQHYWKLVTNHRTIQSEVRLIAEASIVIRLLLLQVLI